MKLFHIVAINERTGQQVRMTGYPMPHDECCVMLTKITKYEWRRLVLVEMKP